MMFILKFLFVVVSMALCDVCWTKYFIHVGKKEPLKSALWSSLTMVCGMITVVGYTDDKRLMPAALIGASMGTYFTVKRQKDVDTK